MLYKYVSLLGLQNAMNCVSMIQHRNSNASYTARERDGRLVGNVDSAICTLAGLEGIVKLEVAPHIVAYFY